MMTIERLEELKDEMAVYLERSIHYAQDMDEDRFEDDITSLIDAEISRQSVTDEEIREVIDWFERENNSLSEDVEDLRETIEKYPFEKMSYSKNTKDWRPFKIKALTSRVERNELAIQALQLFGKSEHVGNGDKLGCKCKQAVCLNGTAYCANCGREL